MQNQDFGVGKIRGLSESPFCSPSEIHNAVQYSSTASESGRRGVCTRVRVSVWGGVGVG